MPKRQEKYYHSGSDTTESILKEPAIAYHSTNLYQLAAHAITKNYIKQILQLSGLSVAELIAIIPISIDTYKRKTQFGAPVTEKILEIEEVYRNGLAAFGESFYSWMNTENLALGGVIPKSLLTNSFGIRMLLDEIGRLEHGILA